MDEQFDEWTNRWIEGQMDEQFDEWTNRQIEGQMDEQFDEWTNRWIGQMDEQFDEWTNRQIEGQMDEQFDEWTNRWIDGWMDGLLDKQIDESTGLYSQWFHLCWDGIFQHGLVVWLGSIMSLIPYNVMRILVLLCKHHYKVCDIVVKLRC